MAWTRSKQCGWRDASAGWGTTLRFAGHDGKRIGGDLAERTERLLDERARYYLRAYFYFNEGHLNNGTAWACSNWQERDAKLFALAAEVAKATGK